MMTLAAGQRLVITAADHHNAQKVAQTPQIAQRQRQKHKGDGQRQLVSARPEETRQQTQQQAQRRAQHDRAHDLQKGRDEHALHRHSQAPLCSVWAMFMEMAKAIRPSASSMATTGNSISLTGPRALY